MCTWVNAIEKARAAALPSRYLRASASAAARSGATPVANVDADDGARRQPDALAQRADRVEHGAGRARQRAAVEHDRVGRRAAAADEARPIGLPFDRAAQARAVDAEHVEADERRFVGRARPAAEQQAGALRIELGLDEQLAERRVREVVLGTRQHDLGVAGHLDLARLRAAVGDRQPPHLHVVFRRHGDLELRFDVGVAAAERDLVEIEGGLEPVGLLADRLVGGRPDAARPRIAQVDVVGAGVGRRVVAPPRDRDVAPHAEAAAGVGDRRGVAPVREEVRVRRSSCAATGSAATRTPAATAAPSCSRPAAAPTGWPRAARAPAAAARWPARADRRGSARRTRRWQTTLASATSDMPWWCAK